MILIDTSVWIEFFKQHTEYVQKLGPLLASRLIVTIEPVFSELLYGVRNKKESNIIRNFWQVLPRIGFDSGSMLEAAEYANSENYHLHGIGLMDAILMKAVMDGDHLLWTLDTRIIRNIDPKHLYQESN